MSANDDEDVLPAALELMTSLEQAPLRCESNLDYRVRDLKAAKNRITLNSKQPFHQTTTVQFARYIACPYETAPVLDEQDMQLVRSVINNALEESSLTVKAITPAGTSIHHFPHHKHCFRRWSFRVSVT